MMTLKTMLICARGISIPGRKGALVSRAVSGLRIIAVSGTDGMDAV